MNSTSIIRKISERGQVTLPKRIRASRSFQNASAIEFAERDGMIVLLPIHTHAPSVRAEQTAILDYTLSDWLHSDNDNLFDLS